MDSGIKISDLPHVFLPLGGQEMFPVVQQGETRVANISSVYSNSSIKISDLPLASTPLGGYELFPIVQQGVTKATPISSVNSGPDVDLGLRALSANWEATYTVFSNNSASYSTVPIDDSNTIIGLSIFL